MAPDAPETEAAAMARLEHEKLALEVTQLQQAVRHGRWKLALAFVGVVGFVAGFLVDRYKTWDQRTWEARVAAKNRRVDRMVAIAAQVDDLYARTLTVLRRDESRSVMLGVAIDALGDKVGPLAAAHPELVVFRDYLGEVTQQLATQRFEYAQWTDAAAIQGEWTAMRARAPTPDFAFYFGDEIATTWPALAAAADDALGQSFSIMGGEHATEARAKLEDLGSRLQGAVHQRIVAAENARP